MTLFVISDTYTTLTFLHCLELLYSDKIDEIFLLSEYHSSIEISYYRKINIRLVANFKEGITNADNIVLIMTKDLLCSYGKIRTLLSNYPYTRLIEIDISNINVDAGTKYSEMYRKIPHFLLLDIGTYTQQFYAEFLLNKILCQKSKNVLQSFSKVALKILEGLTQLFGKNESSLDLFCSQNDNCEVMVSTLQANNLFEIGNIEINEMCPDYILLVTDNRMAINSKVYGSFLKKYDRGINFHIRSMFATMYSIYDTSFPLLSHNYAKDTAIFQSKNIDDEDLSSVLLKDICSKMDISDRIKIIDIPC